MDCKNILGQTIVNRYKWYTRSYMYNIVLLSLFNAFISFFSAFKLEYTHDLKIITANFFYTCSKIFWIDILLITRYL